LELPPLLHLLLFHHQCEVGGVGRVRGSGLERDGLDLPLEVYEVFVLVVNHLCKKEKNKKLRINPNTLLV